MSNIQEALDQIRCRGWITEEITTALYPCSGTDTKAFTFTHPAFFEHRGIVGIPAPNVFVFVDNQDPFDKHNPRFEFHDDRTRVETESFERTTVFGQAGYIFDLVWESTTSPEWGHLSQRKLSVLFLVADWRKFPHYFRDSQWVPDVFIGVCDGCRFGGNAECVNELETHGVPDSLLRSIPVPRYYITDHFRNAVEVNKLEAGDLVTSRDVRFPLRFKKMALLSTEWGHYGHGTLGGATLFEVEKAPGRNA